MLSYRGFLAFKHLVEIHGELANFNSLNPNYHRRTKKTYHLLEVMLGIMIVVRSVQQGLGGNAPDIQAGASQAATALHASHLQAQLSALDR